MCILIRLERLNIIINRIIYMLLNIKNLVNKFDCNFEKLVQVTKEKLLEAIEGHVLGEAVLMAIF